MLDLSDLGLVVMGLFFSAFYSGSEAALISIPIDRTKQLIEEGGRKGKALAFVTKYANELLITILIGNNLVNIFVASITAQMATYYFPGDNALTISVFITTMIIVFVGEIIPKTFGRGKGELLVVPIAFILRLNYYLFLPAVKVTNWITKKILGKNAELNDRLVTRNDIEYLVNKAEKEQSIDSKQIDLLTSILEFPTIKVKDIMVPRQQVQYISLRLPVAKIVEIFKNNNHSRYPVCEGDIDKTVGFLHVKDLISSNVTLEDGFQIKNFLKPPFFVYEHMKIHAVFDHMNRKKVHLAMVKDENGLIVGIITLEDIVEEILGEIQDEHDLDSDNHGGNTKIIAHDNGIIVDGKISLRDLYNTYDVEIPLSDNYSTLAGFLLDRMGNNFPKKGMMIFWENYSFKLEEVGNYEILSVRVQMIEEDPSDS